MSRTTEIKIRAFRFRSLRPSVNRTSGLKTTDIVSEGCLKFTTPKFLTGLSILLPNHSSVLLSGHERENSRERICIVSRGKMLLKSASREDLLSENDCLYASPGAEFVIENNGKQTLEYFWAISNSSSKASQKRKRVIVLRTLSDVIPSIVSLKGMERSIYSIKETETFHFALFFRGPKTYSPLHTHLPRNFEETFTVLSGRLKVTGLSGESFVLGKYDSAFIPPLGGNKNENMSSKQVRYVWVGSPAVDVKEIPVESKYSRYEKALSVDKL